MTVALNFYDSCCPLEIEPAKRPETRNFSMYYMELNYSEAGQKNWPISAWCCWFFGAAEPAQ